MNASLDEIVADVLARMLESRREISAACCLCLSLASCGGATSDSSAGACAGYAPQATAAEIAKTPRADSNAEILALETAGTFTANDALYDRVSGELAAIAVLEPAVASIRPLSAVSRSDLAVTLDGEGFKSWTDGTYHAWDCANAAYGATVTASPLVPSVVSVRFGSKRYQPGPLAKEYAALAHVTAAQPDYGTTDGPDVCLQIDGDTHHYVFDQAGGDCPAGCTTHQYFGFEAKPGGVVTAQGSWTSASPMPEPAWYTQAADCRSRLHLH